MNMDLNLEPFAGMKTMLAVMLTDMAAELAECKRATGGSITKVAVTLARKAAAGSVNVWGVRVRPASDQVRPSPTKKI